MKKILVFIGLIVFTLACGGGKKESEVSNIDGAKLYKSNCVLCHGEDGKLGVNNSKDLTKSSLSLDDRITMVTKGKGAMTGFESLLSKDEIKAVASYTFKLK